jgi:hypothetical protein
MKVRCLRIVSPVDGSELDESSWVRIGHEYVVLTLLIDPSGHVKVQILAEGQSPGYWAGEMFETADETLPPNWVARLRSDGLLEFGPKDWLREGFWDDFHNSEPEARAQYERELSIIIGRGASTA